MANPYPVELKQGQAVTIAGQLTFTDAANQPGGSVPYGENFARIGLVAPTLNVAAARYVLAAADLSIVHQSGTDFSIGNRPDEPSQGAIFSAQGGWFQGAMFFGAPNGVTLDGGNSTQRWLEFYFNMGDRDGSFPVVGVDVFVPVLPPTSPGYNGDLAVTVPSVPGHAIANGPACWAVGVELIAGAGTDEITGAFGNSGDLFIWQVA